MFPDICYVAVIAKFGKWIRYYLGLFRLVLPLVLLLACTPIGEVPATPDAGFESGPGAADDQPPLTTVFEEVTVFVTRESIHKTELVEAFTFELDKELQRLEGIVDEKRIKLAFFSFANPNLPDPIDKDTTIILPKNFKAFANLANLTEDQPVTLSSMDSQLLLITLRPMSFADLAQETGIALEQLQVMNPQIDTNRKIPAYSVLLRPK